MRYFILLMVGLLVSLRGHAQAGSIDASFSSATGPDDLVMAIVVQADGKLLVGGYFTEFDGYTAGRLVRLNSDGTIDNTLTIGSGFDDAVQALAVQSDGKILVGGTFTSINGMVKPGLVRLNINGSLDATFVAPTVLGGISTIAIQPNGKILIGGTAVASSGGFVTNLARLNTNGSLDALFDIDPGPNNTVLTTTVQADGKVLCGGQFTAFQGMATGYLGRASTVGAPDPAFQPGSAANSIVRALAVQPDGKILIAGSFSLFNGQSATRLARLHANGALDTGFSVGSGANSIVHTLALQPDGRVLIGGLFIAYNGIVRNRIARLNANGSLDLTFDVASGANDVVRAIAVQADGNVMVGGGFTMFNAQPRMRLVRLVGTSASSLQVGLKVILEGPFVGSVGLMNDHLRLAGVVPLSEPFTANGYPHVDGGGEVTTSAVLAISGNNAIVDWVLIELRDGNNPALVQATRSALLQRDGDVVAVDGVSPVSLSVSSGTYCVAVRHRNHLGVLTAGSYALSSTAINIDLTTSATSTYGTNARKEIGTKQVMWAGDVTGNGTIAYTGPGNDRDAILVGVGGALPTQVLPNVYSRADTNMDASVKYTGGNNDRDVVLVNVGGTVPTAVRMAQLP